MIRTVQYITNKQIVKTGNLFEAPRSACWTIGEKKSEVHVILDALIGFASGCFRKWIEISGPIPKCGEIKSL